MGIQTDAVLPDGRTGELVVLRSGRHLTVKEKSLWESAVDLLSEHFKAERCDVEEHFAENGEEDE